MTARATQNESKSESRMRPTVPRGRAAANYHSNDPVVRDVALALGMREPSAHQLLYGRDRINRRAVIVIAAFERHGALDRLAHWASPIRVALAGAGLTPLTRQLLRECQACDLAEDEAENEYRHESSDRAARTWVQAIDRLIQQLLVLRDALVRRHNLDHES